MLPRLFTATGTKENLEDVQLPKDPETVAQVPDGRTR